jgi:hypothetical protein
VGASARTNAVVDHSHIEALAVGLDPYQNMRGLRMFDDVGQRFPQHGLDVGDDQVIGHGVQRPDKFDDGPDG